MPGTNFVEGGLAAMAAGPIPTKFDPDDNESISDTVFRCQVRCPRLEHYSSGGTVLQNLLVRGSPSWQ